MKRTINILFLFCFSIIAVAQQPQSDLDKYSQLYPDENFIILNKTKKAIIDIVDGQLTINEENYEEHFYLTSESGFMAEQSISYSGFFSEIENIKAASFIPNKKKYKKIPVEEFKEKDEFSQGIFHDDRKSMNFTFPSVQKGSKTVMEYNKKLKEPRFLGGDYFISYAPIVNQEFIIETHPDIELGISAFNLDETEVKFEESKEKNRKVYRWTSKNLPKPQIDPQSPSISYFAPHVIPFIKTYKANGETKNLLRNTDDLFSWYNGFLEGVNEGRENKEMQSLVDSLVAGTDDELEKVKRIFYWTQDHIKYVAFEDGLGGFIPRQADAVLEKRYGDCKDMASCITKMLDYAKIPGYITWIGSDDIPYRYEEVPTPATDNHMIASYEKDGRFYFLDATSQFTPFGMPTAFIQGKEALVRTNSDDYKIVEVPIVSPETNRIADSLYLQIEDKMLVGNGHSQIGGFYKSRLLNRINSRSKKEKEKFYKSYLKKGSNKFLIVENSLTEQNVNNRDKAIEVDYEFTIADYVRQNEDEIYINLNLVDWFEGDRIEEDRETPIRYEFKTQQLLHATLEIPEGYEVSWTPDPIELDNDLYKFKTMYKTEQNKVIIEQESYLDFLQLEKEHFEDWNSFLDEINDARFQAIILKKK